VTTLTDELSRRVSVSVRVAVTTTGSILVVSWAYRGDRRQATGEAAMSATPMTGAAGMRRSTETSLEVMGP
jgi:hypothetical protein